jgi:hypothetical protein
MIPTRYINIAGTKTTSKDNECVVQRRRYIIFTEAHLTRAKGHNINGEKRRTSGGGKEREREREIIYTNGKT